jgi:hypothetical protein
LAVCSITHDAIFWWNVSTRWPVVSPRRDDPPARDDPIAPAAARTAAIRNSEQKIRRQIGGANVDVCLGFVVIELPMRLFCSRNQFFARPWQRRMIPVFFILFGERAPKTPLF